MSSPLFEDNVTRNIFQQAHVYKPTKETDNCDIRPSTGHSQNKT